MANPISQTPVPVTPVSAAAADNAVVTTLHTALPGQASSPVAPSSLGTKEAPVIRTLESNSAPAEVSPAQNSEMEPSREKEMNLERLEAQIHEAKARGPKKVAVAADTLPVEEPKTVAQPVVILPLTEQKMSDAKKKSPVYSVKWLWTWCRRQMKKFAKIIVMYREPPQT
jgi:hypothetical protein